MSPKARESLITSVVLLAVFGFLFARTFQMPSTPALFLCMDIRKHGKGSGAEGGVHFKEISMPLLAFLAIVGYVVLFRLFGYFPATAVMLVGFMAVLKVRPWRLILAIMAGYSVFIYLMFVVWLKVSIL